MRIIAAEGAFLVGCFQTRVACQDKMREGKGGRPGHLIKLYFSHANKAMLLLLLLLIFRKAQSRGQTSFLFIYHLSKKRCSFSLPPLRLKCLLLFNIHKYIANSVFQIQSNFSE